MTPKASSAVQRLRTYRSAGKVNNRKFGPIPYKGSMTRLREAATLRGLKAAAKKTGVSGRKLYRD